MSTITVPLTIRPFEGPEDRHDVSLTEDLRRQERRLAAAFMSSVAQARADVARQARASACVVNLLQAGVKVGGPRTVAYLADHNTLIPAVMIVVRKATILEPTDDLTVTVYRDRETGDEYLSLLIRRAIYDEKLLALMDVLQDLAERNMPDASGWLLVTTDFRPPIGHAR